MVDEQMLPAINKCSLSVFSFSFLIDIAFARNIVQIYGKMMYFDYEIIS
jgi:hypothetical protein